MIGSGFLAVVVRYCARKPQIITKSNRSPKGRAALCRNSLIVAGGLFEFILSVIGISSPVSLSRIDTSIS